MVFSKKKTREPANPQAERLARRLWLQTLPLTLVANLIIAVFLTAATGDPLASNLLYSNAIGLSILLVHALGHWLLGGSLLPKRTVTAASIPLGSAMGLLIAWSIQGGPFRDRLKSLPSVAVSVLVLGAVASWFFWARARLVFQEAQQKTLELEKAESARRLAEAELKLLQAQIEPHFLFNTLSNVLSLIDGDPPRAKRMLHNLTGYLRGSLRRTRAGDVTLGEELDLVRAYLEIQAVRMGPRLAFRIACPEDLREVTLPPLLLQPLVENALRHGLDPRPRGGAVSVSAGREDGALTLEVRDDGVGLDPRRPAGVGLTNVRRRVEAVSAGQGSLTLRPLAEGGLCARIVLPLLPTARAAEAHA